MVWSAPFDYTPGQVLTAANLDTYLSGNMNETAPGKVTTAGDIVYATGANAITRLALTAGGILIGKASAPGYSTPQYAEVATSESTGSTSYTDLATAGPSITVNTPNGNALILWARLDANATSGSEGYVGVRVDSTDPPNGFYEARSAMESTGTPNRTTIGFAWITGLSAANHTFKLRYKTTAGTHFFSSRKIWGLGL